MAGIGAFGFITVTSAIVMAQAIVGSLWIPGLIGCVILFAAIGAWAGWRNAK